MNQYQCLIIEPSASAAAELKEYLRQLLFFAPPDVCPTVAEAWERIQKKPYDLIWLDVTTPTSAGVDFIRAISRTIPFIVTSTQADFAVKSFELGVSDYLLKPFTFPRLTRAVNRALSARPAPDPSLEPSFLFLKKGHIFQRFDYQEIEHVQAYGTYCKIIGQRKVDVVNDTISGLEQALPSQQFLRIHKSYIVNLGKITGYSYRNIAVGPHQLPLGAAYRERFQGFLNLLGKKESESFEDENQIVRL